MCVWCVWCVCVVCMCVSVCGLCMCVCENFDVAAIAEVQNISFYFVSRVNEPPSPVPTGQDVSQNIVQSVCVLMLGFFAQTFSVVFKFKSI